MALVLSRQRDQSVMIGDNIEVICVDIRGDKVRLGFNVPRETSVHRKEIYDRIRRENPPASSHHHDEAELDDVPAIIAEAEEFCVSYTVNPQETFWMTSSEAANFVRGRLADQMIGRLAMLLSQERKTKKWK